MHLRAGQRLRRNDDFRAVREQGRRLDCGAFLLTWAPRPGSAPAAVSRVGVVASRAAVGDAVHRNRAKRLVLTARAALLRLEFAEVEQRFTAACQKLVPKPA
jgi:ribonuclease P protein component